MKPILIILVLGMTAIPFLRAEPDIIPRPYEVRMGDGFYFQKQA